MRAKSVIIAAFMLAVSHAAFSADNPTAFALVKAGDKYVGDQSKDKVVQIRSEKSVGSITPNIWYIVYYDPDATFKSVQVKFGAGEKMDVSHPWRLLEMAGDQHKTFDNDKLKIDSDRAIKTATTQPLLSNLTIKATQLWLIHGDTAPEWKVQLWAAKLNNPNATADIGAVYLSATDGSIIRADLHPDRVD
jgi:hypothetical protein